MLRRLKHLVQDPPPPVVVEIGAEGVSAFKRDPKTGEIAARVRHDLPPGLLDPSPNRQNVHDAQAFDELVGAVLDKVFDAAQHNGCV